MQFEPPDEDQAATDNEGEEEPLAACPWAGDQVRAVVPTQRKIEAEWRRSSKRGRAGDALFWRRSLGALRGF